MEFFDDAVSKTKEVFDVVSKKTGEVINAGKIKYEIATIRSKVKKDYEKLGKIYFDEIENAEGLTAEVGEIVSDIKEKKEKEAELNAALGTLKDCVVCPKCGAAQDKNANFCNVCGQKIDI